MSMSPFAGIVTDAELAVRALRRHPGFPAFAVAVASSSIALVTAVFTLFNGLYLAALPYSKPERLVSIHESAPSIAELKISRRIGSTWAKYNRTFESLSLYQEDGGSPPPLARTRFVSRVPASPGLWDRTLGITPILGRDFNTGDDRPGAPCSMLLGYDLWRTNLHSSLTAIGSSSLSTTRLAPSSAFCRGPRFFRLIPNTGFRSSSVKTTPARPGRRRPSEAGCHRGGSAARPRAHRPNLILRAPENRARCGASARSVPRKALALF